MGGMTFEWDDSKEARNFDKHGVSFDEASSVFMDPFFLVFQDPDHSEGEHRFLIFGSSSQGRCLVVSYTERGDSVRIISAREMTRTERKSYEEDP